MKQTVAADSAVLVLNNMDKMNLLPNQKLCLSIEEAAEYSMIGENKLRQIISQDNTLDWVLQVGRWQRIKRPQFERWVEKQYYL